MPPTSRTYTIVLDWLEEQLRSGEVAVGDKLPGERHLAEKFGISRASVREALRILDVMGLIRSSTGSGPTSGAVVVSEASSALAWALRMHVATRALPIRDLVQTRLLLETQSAVEAAAMPETPQRSQVLDRATALLDLMDDPDLAAKQFHVLDTEFHILLTSLADNVVVDTIMASLRQATIGYVQETVSGLEEWPTVSRTLQTQHREILAAFTDRRGQDASDALDHHITWFYKLSEQS